MKSSKTYNLWAKKPVHVAVEGANFMHFLMQKIKDHDDLYGNIYLHDFKQRHDELGQLDLRRWLRLMQAHAETSNVAVVGVVHDAEYGLQNTIASIKNDFNFVFSLQPEPNQIIRINSLAISYLVVPTNTEGCLEHAMLAASPPSNQKQCAKAFVDCLGNDVKNANQKAKIQVRSMIAAHDPDMWFSHSAQSSLWDWEQPSLKVILDFLSRLNNLAT